MVELFDSSTIGFFIGTIFVFSSSSSGRDMQEDAESQKLF
jgi:hypothetical protein